MNAKGKSRISTRTVLIILIVILIAFSAYYLITNYSGETDDVLTIDKVNSNKEYYIENNLTIEIKGYYYDELVENQCILTSSPRLTGQSSTTTEESLLVDYTNAESTDFSRGEGVLYTVKGKLTNYELNEELPILLAEEIKPK